MDLLLVEDDASLRDAWASALARDGFDVREAADAEQALALARSEPRPALAVLDLGLPPRSGDPEVGLALLQRLLLELPRLKVVVLTGQEEAAVSWRAVGLGAFDFLVKPASRSQMAQALARARLFVQAEQQAMAGGGVARITVTAPLDEGVREFGEAAQERLVRAVMAECDWNVARAARRLGLSRENLYYFLRKFGIERPAA